MFATRTSERWVAELVAAGVPAARVNDVAEALRDPQAVSRETVVGYRHPTLGDVRLAGSPLRLTGELPEPARAPLLGEHTDDVLRELCGYDQGRIGELRAAGVVGQPRPEEHRWAESTARS